MKGKVDASFFPAKFTEGECIRKFMRGKNRVTRIETFKENGEIQVKEITDDGKSDPVEESFTMAGDSVQLKISQLRRG